MILSDVETLTAEGLEDNVTMLQNTTLSLIGSAQQLQTYFKGIDAGNLLTETSPSLSIALLSSFEMYSQIVEQLAVNISALYSNIDVLDVAVADLLNTGTTIPIAIHACMLHLHLLFLALNYSSMTKSLLADTDAAINWAIDAYNNMVIEYNSLLDTSESVNNRLANITRDVVAITDDLVLANSTAAEAQTAFLERQAILVDIAGEEGGVADELSLARGSLDVLRMKLAEAKLAASQVTREVSVYWTMHGFFNYYNA